jgi:hypothetical protein
MLARRMRGLRLIPPSVKVRRDSEIIGEGAGSGAKARHCEVRTAMPPTSTTSKNALPQEREDADPR